MSHRSISMLLVAVLLGALHPAARVASAEESGDALVEQLRGDDFDARQTAKEKLAAMGETARPLLLKAATSDDPEIRQIAAQLLANLKKSTVRIMGFDRDGKPAVGAEADVRFGKMPQGNGGDETSKNITLKADASSEFDVQPTIPLNFGVAWKSWNVSGVQPLTWSLALGSGTNPLLYTLAKPGSVTVHVNDADGKPLKDARVSLNAGMRLDQDLLEMQLVRFGQTLQYTANADAKGVATLENVPEGVYQVVVRADNFLSKILPAVRVRENATTDGGTAALTAAVPAKVSFVLKRADGSSAKGKTIDYALEPVLEGPHVAETRKSLAVLHQWNGGRNKQQGPVADENGKVVLDNVTPGKYTLVFRCDQKTPQHMGPFEVKSGETLELGDYQEIAGGNLSGKVTAPDGKSPGYVYLSVLPEQEVIDGLADGVMVDWRFTRQDSLTSFRGNPNQSTGAYELKDLPPGRYAVCMMSQFGASACYFGAEVASGKTAQIPDIELGASGKTQDLKGRVTLWDGRPAVGATVNVMLSTQGSAMAVCDADGGFKMMVMTTQQGDPVSLSVRAAGCKPKSQDLTHGDVKFDALNVALEKQDFGDVRIKVVDEDGKPLAGAAVYPAPKISLPQHRKTNQNGELDLTGLATGNRTLVVECEGYFAHEPKVVIAPDTMSQATITLRKGFTLKGRVTAPAGIALNTVSVSLTSTTTQYKAVDAEGRFAFDGLLPAEYTITATGPALIARESAHLTLTPELKDVPELQFELVHASGVAVNLGTEFEGYNVFFSTEKDEAAKPQTKNPYDRSASAASVVDASGRAEFWGLVPGAYDLQLNSAQRMYNYYGRINKVGAVQRVIRNLQVPELKTVADLKTATPLEVKLEPATGSITGRLALDGAPPGVATTGNLTLMIRGPGASSTLSYGYPQEFRGAFGKVTFSGKVPAGLKPPESGLFTVKGLPAGEYTVKADLNLYRTRTIRTGMNMWSSSMEQDNSKREPQLLKTFTLKEGEQLDLGSLLFKQPTETMEAMTHVEEASVEDQVPSFQP